MPKSKKQERDSRVDCFGRPKFSQVVAELTTIIMVNFPGDKSNTFFAFVFQALAKDQKSGTNPALNKAQNRTQERTPNEHFFKTQRHHQRQYQLPAGEGGRT
jgi:hypothetical protein